MSIRKLPLHAPRTPAPEFFEDPTNTIRTADGRALVGYCPVTHCGLIYDFGQRSWTFTSPVTFAEFGVMLSEMGVEFTPSEELSTWIRSRGAQASSTESPVAH